jgi:malate dehydrogenase (quinone)
VQAGIRVQAIKKADRGAVYFGTEVFSSADRSIAALLGASPGASVSVNIALEVVQTCLPHLLTSAEGQERMRRMIPTFDHDLKQSGHAALFEKTSREATERLQLHPQTNQPIIPSTTHHHEQT